MLEFLYTPQEDINYNFIASLYAVGTLLAIIFAVLDVIYELEEIKGFWIIFCPFAPALLWSIVMRHRWNANFKKDKED